MYSLFAQQSHRQVLIFALFLKKSYVIICIRMHIYLVLTRIHHRGGRSKHATVISFLLPRLINNSWVTIARSEIRGGGGGGGGHPEILSLSRIPSTQEGEIRAWNQGRKHKHPSGSPSHTHPRLQQKGGRYSGSSSSSLTLQASFRHSSVRPKPFLSPLSLRRSLSSTHTIT